MRDPDPKLDPHQATLRILFYTITYKEEKRFDGMTKIHRCNSELSPSAIIQFFVLFKINCL